MKGPARSYSGEAESRAATFLIAARGADGWWRDFETLAGISDAWVTAYAACALHARHDAESRAAAEGAFRLLLEKSPDGGPWSYNARVPPDADTTVWVCRLASAVGRWPESCAGATRFLANCVRENGGIATYPSADRVRRTMKMPPDAPFIGWLSAHGCVTAAGAHLPGATFQRGAIEYLRRTQNGAGRWEPYWWMDREYSTSLAVEALAAAGLEADKPAIQGAVRWARAQGCSGSPFAIACRLRIAYFGADDLAGALAEELLRSQRSDGSWDSSARMRIPPPDVEEPAFYTSWDTQSKGAGSVRVDQNRIFTTATALAALAGAPPRK